VIKLLLRFKFKVVVRKMLVNGARLLENFNILAGIGSTKNGGITRLALTNEDKEARNQVVKWMQEIDLKVRIDDFGNIFGRKEGRIPNAPPIVIGSHIDSVKNGGRFDGVIGVLAGIEILQTITEKNIGHDYSLEVAVFTNEEGARFQRPMLGSAAMAGAISQEQVYNMQDDSGKFFIDELKRIGYLGNKESRLKEVKLFAEVHIEQGTILEENNKRIGIVQGISGLSWLKASFFGQSDHAASTPMIQRKDALVSAANVINNLTQWAKEKMDNSLITFGKMNVRPNIANVIPNEVSISIDIRDFDNDRLLSSTKYVKEQLYRIAEENNVVVKIEESVFQEPAIFNKNLIDKLEVLCISNQVPYHKMLSGAGHDAMYMNRLGNTIMLFIPSVEGKSHCEEEHSDWDDILLSIDTLYRLIEKELN
jgi:N-carbamoyl-L-amino-acid hydrolase